MTSMSRKKKIINLSHKPYDHLSLKSSSKVLILGPDSVNLHSIFGQLPRTGSGEIEAYVWPYLHNDSVLLFNMCGTFPFQKELCHMFLNNAESELVLIFQPLESEDYCAVFLLLIEITCKSPLSKVLLILPHSELPKDKQTSLEKEWKESIGDLLRYHIDYILKTTKESSYAQIKSCLINLMESTASGCNVFPFSSENEQSMSKVRDKIVEYVRKHEQGYSELRSKLYKHFHKYSKHSIEDETENKSQSVKQLFKCMPSVTFKQKRNYFVSVQGNIIELFQSKFSNFDYKDINQEVQNLKGMGLLYSNLMDSTSFNTMSQSEIFTYDVLTVVKILNGLLKFANTNNTTIKKSVENTEKHDYEKLESRFNTEKDVDISNEHDELTNKINQIFPNYAPFSSIINEFVICMQLGYQQSKNLEIVIPLLLPESVNKQAIDNLGSSDKFTIHAKLQGFLPLTYFMKLSLILLRTMDTDHFSGSKISTLKKDYLHLKTNEGYVILSQAIAENQIKTITIKIETSFTLKCVSGAWDQMKRFIYMIECLQTHWPGVVAILYQVCPICGVCSWDLASNIYQSCSTKEIQTCTQTEGKYWPSGFIFPLPEEEDKSKVFDEMMRYKLKERTRNRTSGIDSGIYSDSRAPTSEMIYLPETCDMVQQISAVNNHLDTIQSQTDTYTTYNNQELFNAISENNDMVTDDFQIKSQSNINSDSTAKSEMQETPVYGMPPYKLTGNYEETNVKTPYTRGPDHNRIEESYEQYYKHISLEPLIPSTSMTYVSVTSMDSLELPVTNTANETLSYPSLTSQDTEDDSEFNRHDHTLGQTLSESSELYQYNIKPGNASTSEASCQSQSMDTYLALVLREMQTKMKRVPPYIQEMFQSTQEQQIVITVSVGFYEQALYYIKQTCRKYLDKGLIQLIEGERPKCTSVYSSY